MPNYWWVNQGTTYDRERDGGYVWAPTVTKAGRPVNHHTNVQRLKTGDVLIHYANGAIRAIGSVQSAPEVHARPDELPSEPWGREGYLAKIEYHELRSSITLNLVPGRAPGEGPFDSHGGVKQGYLFPLSFDFAKRLASQFVDRWPVAWLDSEHQRLDPKWDEYIYWAKRFREWKDFDKNERDYKVILGGKLAAIRAQLGESASAQAGTQVEELRSVVCSNENNLMNWRRRDDVKKWMQTSPAAARDAVAHLWEPLDDVADAVDAFAGAVRKDIQVPFSGLVNFASVLLMGVDAKILPPYRKNAYDKAYGLTGFSSPADDATHGEVYEHALTFLDATVSEAAARKVNLRDRLDAQSVLWCITKYGKDDLPEHWSDVDKQRFHEFVTGSLPPTVSQKKNSQDALEELAEELYLDVEYLRRIEALLKHKRQVIFYGPPGTGKTYVAKKLAEVLASEPGKIAKVQFHPSYAYEDFVEGYRPKLIGGVPGFDLVKGPLRRIASEAEHSDGICILLIDEINRGNIAKIFGELYFLLEYRRESLSLQYSQEPAILPENLWIIGTMNTADRSIALIDAALRRRFHFVPFFPDQPPVQGLLRRWLTANKPDLVWLADAVDRANEKLGNAHIAIGPSHFMDPNLDGKWVNLIWEHSVLPYIEEQLFLGEETKDRLGEFALDKLRIKYDGSSGE